MKITKVSKTFGNHQVLKNISLDFPAGQNDRFGWPIRLREIHYSPLLRPAGAAGKRKL